LAIASKLKPYNRVRLAERNENSDLLLVKGRLADSLIVTATGFPFSTSGNRPLEQELSLYGRYKYLKELTVTDPAINVEVKAGKMKDGIISFKEPNAVFKIGDTMILSIKNLSKIPVYVNIIDLQPDGVVNSIYPEYVDNTENKFRPGRHVILEEMQLVIGPPVGNEILKVFVSEKPIDMKKLDGTYYNVTDFVLMELGVSGKTAVFSVPLKVISSQ
jgi:metacaspase-1